MKYFGTNSLSSISSRILRILFYLTAFGTAVGFTVIIILRLLFPDTDNLLWSFSLNGMTLITGEKEHFPLILIFSYMLLSLPVIGIIYKLMFFFKNLSEERIFIEDNFILLRSIGLLFTLTGFLKSIINYINWNCFLDSTVSSAGSTSLQFSLSLSEPWKIISRRVEMDAYSMSYALISEPELIMIGVAVIFFSHLFKVALSIKNENDLTI